MSNQDAQPVRKPSLLAMAAGQQADLDLSDEELESMEGDTVAEGADSEVLATDAAPEELVEQDAAEESATADDESSAEVEPALEETAAPVVGLIPEDFPADSDEVVPNIEEAPDDAVEASAETAAEPTIEPNEAPATDEAAPASILSQTPEQDADRGEEAPSMPPRNGGKAGDAPAPRGGIGLSAAIGAALGGGAGLMAAGLSRFSAGSPEQRASRVAEKYSKMLASLDEAIMSGQGSADRMKSSTTGRMIQGFFDAGSPVAKDAVSLVFERDEDAKKAWKKVKANNEVIGKLARKLGVLGAQSGMDPEAIKADIDTKLDKYGEQVKDKLNGFYDSEGNSLRETFDKAMERISRMLETLMNGLKSMLGLKSGATASQSSGPSPSA